MELTGLRHLENQNPMNAMQRLLLLIALSLVGACGEKQSPQAAPDEPSLRVTTLQPEQRTVYQAFAATLEGRQSVEIRPKVSGFIDKIYIEEGQQVRKGQPLFRLETASLTQEAEAAKAVVDVAQVEVDKLVPLVEKGIISQVQLVTAQARLQQVKSNYESLIANIGYATLNSPVDGYAGNIPYKVGSLVDNSIDLPMTVVSDISEIRAYFSMTEKQLLQWKLQWADSSGTMEAGRDANVELIMVNGQAYPHPGRIAMVNTIIDRATGNVSLRADFPNPEQWLSSGSSGRIRIPTVYRDVVVVPMTATVDLQGHKLVYVVGEDGTVHTRPIQIGAQTATEYLVPSGLEPGTTIVTEGVSKLKDGQTIKPVRD